MEKLSRTRSRVTFHTSIILDIDGERLAFDNTHDISMNGVFVSTAKPMAVGRQVPFELTLNVGMRNEVIKGMCQVVRSVSLDDALSGEEPGSGMGFKFLDLDDDSSAFLY